MGLEESLEMQNILHFVENSKLQVCNGKHCQRLWKTIFFQLIFLATYLLSLAIKSISLMLSNILFSNTLRLVGSAILNVGVIVLIVKVMLVFDKRSSLLVTRLNSSYNFTKIRIAVENYRIIFDLKI